MYKKIFILEIRSFKRTFKLYALEHSTLIVLRGVGGGGHIKPFGPRISEKCLCSYSNNYDLIRNVPVALLMTNTKTKRASIQDNKK